MGAAVAVLRAQAARIPARERRIAMAIAGSLGAKLISVLTLLISVPWTLHYLGAERYGMWVTLSSFSAMLSVADLGVGNGLMTALARTSGHDDPEALRRLISNGLAAMIAVATGAGLIFLQTLSWINWGAVFNVKSSLARAEAMPAAVTFVVCLLSGIPLGIGSRLFMGLQRGAEGGIWAAASSLSSLVGIVVAINLELSLPALVFCFVGVPLLVQLIASLSILLRNDRALLPSIRHVRIAETLGLCHSGMLFLLLQLVSSLTYTTDNIVIAQMLGAGAVAPYSVADRLFGLIAIVMMMFNTPLWPAYAEASARGDVTWIKRTFKRSLAMNLLLPGLGASFLLVFGSTIIHYWVGGSIIPPMALLIALTVRRLIESVASACSMLLNGLHIVTFQVVWGIAMAAAAIGLRLAFVKMFGLSGSAIGVTIAVLLFGVLPNLIYIPHLLRRLGARNVIA
jgi:O-antigen/teichoic acid export membrane protein